MAILLLNMLIRDKYKTVLSVSALICDIVWSCYLQFSVCFLKLHNDLQPSVAPRNWAPPFVTPGRRPQISLQAGFANTAESVPLLQSIHLISCPIHPSGWKTHVNKVKWLELWSSSTNFQADPDTSFSLGETVQSTGEVLKRCTSTYAC